jgi:hypothetical protein
VSHRCHLPIAALVLLVATAAAQSPTRGFPQPPPSMDPENRAPTKQGPATSARHGDLTQAQREAEELARTAQSIPADVSKVREGMLPKDVIEKLKTVEKLAKRLRMELNP